MCVCTCTPKKAINFSQRTSRWPREKLQCVTTRTGSLRVDPQEPWRQRLGCLLCPVWEHWTCWQAQGFPIINGAHKSKGLPAASLTRRVEKSSWEYAVPSMGWQGAICCCCAKGGTHINSLGSCGGVESRPWQNTGSKSGHLGSREALCLFWKGI